MAFPNTFTKQEMNSRKTALVDSSVWVSYYEKGTKFRNSEDILARLVKNDSRIFLPTMVYVEVINVLKRLYDNQEYIDEVKFVFKNSKNIEIVHESKYFWLNNIEKYNNLVRLKSADLIILAHALELGVDDFYTFDKKLQRKYIYLKKLYEEKTPN